MPVEKNVSPESYCWAARHTRLGWHVSLARLSAKRWVQYEINGLILETIIDVQRLFPNRHIMYTHYKCGCTSTNEPIFVTELKPVPMPAQPAMPPIVFGDDPTLPPQVTC